MEQQNNQQANGSERAWYEWKHVTYVVSTLVAVFSVTAKKIKLGFAKCQFLKHVKYLPFLILDFLWLKLFGCSGGNALLVLTRTKKLKRSRNNSRSVFCIFMKFSDLICGQEPNNIITEEEININAMGQESVRQPKNHVIFFWLNDSLLSWPFYLVVILTW